MNQIIAIALGGSFGAVLRFFVASGVSQWLGRDFPYGTLTVNVIGSFLLGLSTEALIVHRIALGAEYRSAVAIGFIGAFTTFSTFALETVGLIEQDELAKAILNIFASVLICLFAVSLGLLLGRALFLHGGVIQWQGSLMPGSLLLVNALMAFLIGLILGVLLHKAPLAGEHHAALLVFSAGLFLILSGLYVIFYMLEQGYSIERNNVLVLAVFAGNTVTCMLALSLAFWLSTKL